MSHLSLPLNWRRKGSLVGPPATESPVNSIVVDASYLRPLAHTFGLAIQCECSIRCAVAHLLSVRCPSAVARLVVSVVILAVNRVFRRGAWTHVFQKRIKRSSPSWANRNSSSAVIRKCVVAMVFAAVNHSAPHAVFRNLVAWIVACRAAGATLGRYATHECFFNNLMNAAAPTLACPISFFLTAILDCNGQYCPTPELTTFKWWSLGALSPHCAFKTAPTTLWVRKVGAPQYPRCAATALAFPHVSLLVDASESNNRPIFDFLSREVFDAGSGNSTMCFSHDMTLLERVALWLEAQGGSSRLGLRSFYGI